MRGMRKLWALLLVLHHQPGGRPIDVHRPGRIDGRTSGLALRRARDFHRILFRDVLVDMAFCGPRHRTELSSSAFREGKLGFRRQARSRRASCCAYHVGVRKRWQDRGRCSPARQSTGVRVKQSPHPTTYGLSGWGWNPSEANRSGPSGSENLSTTSRGSRSVSRSAAACPAAHRSPTQNVAQRPWQRRKRAKGSDAPMTTRRFAEAQRAAVTIRARSSAKRAGDR